MFSEVEKDLPRDGPRPGLGRGRDGPKPGPGLGVELLKLENRKPYNCS